MSDRIATNPFCTRYFQPGSIPFFFHPPMTLDSLVQSISQSSSPRVAIVGPHGSGKSTLLAHITQHPALSASNGSICQIRFQAGESMGYRWRAIRQVPNTRLLVVDGWEQMDSVLQWFTRARAKARGIRILATAHALPVRFTEIWRTRIDTTIEQHVLTYMLRDFGKVGTTHVTRSQAWQQSRQRHGENLRESLFDMYDWYRDQVDVETTSG